MKIDPKTKENMRELFDTVSDGAQKLGNVVCKGAVKLGHQASLTYEIEKRKAHLSGIYRKIGKIVAESSLSDGNENAAGREPLFRLIDEAAAEKKAIAHLTARRTQSGCPFCHDDAEKSSGSDTPCDGDAQ